MPFPALPLLLLAGGAFALSQLNKPSQASAPPPGTLDPNLPPAVAQQVAQALNTGTDPNALEAAASALASQGYPMAAAALRAKAMMLRTSATMATAMQTTQSIMSPGFVPSIPTPSPEQTAATAQQVVQQAQDTAASAPHTTPAVTQAAQAAVTAMHAATTMDPATAVQAAQQATQAAQTALSQPAATQAAQASQTAAAAVLAQDPQLAATAAHQAVQAAQTALLTTTAQANNVPPPPPAPVVPSLDPNLVALAAAAADTVRSKGCWKEDRSKVKAFQAARGGTATSPGNAGVADGMYGPTTALDMMNFLPKVPAPCYWPSDPTKRAAAQRDWQSLVKTGKVTIGGLGQNPFFVGAVYGAHPVLAPGSSGPYV
jgi:hypothetical protein